MDAATLQIRIYKGYAKAALRIGYLTDQYRPTSAINPLAVSNKLRTLNVSFNAEDMKYGRPNKYGKPTWYGVYDGTLSQVGDYLISAKDCKFFVAAQQQALPILLIECNRLINLLRPQQISGVGAVGYGGDVDVNESVLMTAWPASVLIGGRGDKNEVNLPGDTRNGGFLVLLPYFTGVIIRTDDIITDDQKRRFIVQTAELSDLGWRLQTMQVQT